MTRGMYASILTDHIGGYKLPNVARGILGNSFKETALANYIKKNGFTSISLYNLHTILNSQSLSSRLANLIRSLRNHGVTEINGVVASQGDVNQISRHNALYSNQFDGAITEIEFWNAGADAVSTLKDTATILGTIQSAKLVSACYIGWLSQVSSWNINQVAALLTKNADRILVHAYVKDPAQASGYIGSRVAALKAAKSNIDIRPIFSAEGVGFSAGPETFMGDWLKTHTFSQAEAALPGYSGFQYYEYGFLRAIG